jgi:hypothetical protein
MQREFVVGSYPELDLMPIQAGNTHIVTILISLPARYFTQTLLLVIEMYRASRRNASPKVSEESAT